MRVLGLILVLIAGCGDDGSAPDDAGGGSDTGPTTMPDAGPPAMPVMVETSYGPVTGRDHGTHLSFLGIPYAAPPVGDLRFQPPEPPAAWTEPRDASAFGASCMQPDTLLLGPEGPQSEDCLFLNVYTPALSPAAPLPVMVWIHGGAFQFGSASISLYDGARLAGEGAVIVTINYRLGAFGFLAHPALVAEDENGSAGNYGFLDQIAALEWVRDNAAAFGGDPARVTVFGESAGGISACLHVHSPLSAGLFHGAIVQSGSCAVLRQRLHTEPDETETSAEAIGESIAMMLGCGTTAAPADAACLRGKTADEINALNAGTSGADLLTRERAGPNIDGWAIPEAPLDAMAGGRFGGVPIIAGVNSEEAALFTTGITIENDTQYAALVESLAPGLSDEVLAAYPASDFGGDPHRAFDQFFSDLAFVCPTRLLLRAAADRSIPTAPAYGYYFTRANPGLATLGFGPTHAVELPYVFGNFVAPFRGDATDRALSDAMRAYWTSFAASDAPAAEGASAWPAFTAGTESQLELGDPIRVLEGVRIAECDRIGTWFLPAPPMM